MQRQKSQLFYLKISVIAVVFIFLVPSVATAVQHTVSTTQQTLKKNELISMDSEATRGRKLLRAGTDGTLHFLFRSKGFLSYTWSGDKGENWKQVERVPFPPSFSVMGSTVFDEGFTLAVDKSNTPHVVFIRRFSTFNQDIYRYEVWHTQRRANGQWDRPQILYRDTCYYLGNIILQIKGNEVGQVCFTHVRGGFFGIHYFRFDLATGKPVSSNHQYFADVFSFDFDVDHQGNPHVVYWYRGGYDIRVIYRYWDPDHSVWSGPLTVSPGGDQFFNCAPKLTVGANNDVHIIWANQDGWYNIDCYYRKRSSNQWEATEQATQNTGGQHGIVLVNNQPCIIMNDFIQHGEDFDYDIYYALRGDQGWLGGRVNMSASPTVHSLYPHAVAIGSTLYTFWNEGNESPYTLKFDRRIPHLPEQ